MQEFTWNFVQGCDLIVSHWRLHKDKNRCAKKLVSHSSLLSHIIQHTNCLPFSSGNNCLQLLFSFHCSFYHPIIPACIRWQVCNHGNCFLLILLLDFPKTIHGRTWVCIVIIMFWCCSLGESCHNGRKSREKQCRLYFISSWMAWQLPKSGSWLLAAV